MVSWLRFALWFLFSPEPITAWRRHQPQGKHEGLSCEAAEVDRIENFRAAMRRSENPDSSKQEDK